MHKREHDVGKDTEVQETAEEGNQTGRCTVVSRIYAPCFATLTIVESVGEADLIFYLANTPPLLVPHLDVDVANMTDRSSRSALTTSSETRWSRSTDRGWPQRRQRRFPSIPWVCHFNVRLLIDTTREHACD